MTSSISKLSIQYKVVNKNVPGFDFAHKVMFYHRCKIKLPPLPLTTATYAVKKGTFYSKVCNLSLR